MHCLVHAEIGGGWLVWQTVRNKKPWYYLVGGERCTAGAHIFNPCAALQ